MLARAREVLAGLEQTDVQESPRTATAPLAGSQLGLFQSGAKANEASGPTEVERALMRLDVNRTTPFEALKLIDRLQKSLRKKQGV